VKLEAEAVMRRAQATAVIAVLLLAGCSPAPDATTGTPSAPAGTPSGTSTSATGPQTLGRPATVVDGLDAPWSLAALPGGGFLVSQRDDGRILEVGPTGSAREAGTVPGVVHVGEGGLNGIALWTGDGGTWLYAYHATAADNRVVRMRLTGGAGSYGLSAPQPVLTGIRAASTHNGGRLAFGPDGMLYITTGDAQHSDDAQDRDSLNGKILRVTPEGDPAPGNPFGNAVYSYGHRNVQGIAWTPDGTMWATEFGQNTWDELNVIVPGGDYGWPVVEGRAGNPRYRDPLLQWPTDQASPSGLAAVGDTLYLACLRGERVWQVRTAGAQVVGDAVAQLTGFGRIRDVAPDGNGGLWVLTNNTDGRGSPRPGDDRVLRVTVNG
jgi:glucose/arabinose dehydrogenase